MKPETIIKMALFVTTKFPKPLFKLAVFLYSIYKKILMHQQKKRLVT